MKATHTSLLSLLALIVASTLAGCGTVEDINEPTASARGSQALHGADPSGTYGELASFIVTDLFADLEEQLRLIDDKTLPHEAKSVRKLIGRIRLYIDLFAYAYDYDDNYDIWQKLRDDLDEGYETMGGFKDIYDAMGISVATRDEATGEWGDGVHPRDIDYDDDEVEEVREDVLDWLDGFFSKQRIALYRYYLRAANLEKICLRPKASQSKFIWGGVSVVPDPDRTGLENLGLLTFNLATLAENDYLGAIELDDLTDTENEEIFHDFRKRVRSVLKLHAEFPQIIAEEASNQQWIMATLDEMVSRYGDVNDLLIGYHRLVDADKRKKAKKLAKKINKQWDDLRDWQTERQIDDVLVRLEGILIY